MRASYRLSSRERDLPLRNRLLAPRSNSLPLARSDSRKLKSRYSRCAIRCPVYTDTVIATLSDFFAVFHSLLEPGREFWFRGHSKISYRLCPSALRYRELEERELALSLVGEMKRFLEFKLPRPPAPADHLGWMQVAQHYGLPTRLLDWTQNAAAALFFACRANESEDGLVAVLNPIDLNSQVDPKRPRVFNVERDFLLVERNLSLSGKETKRGPRTIAINPTWNTERIAMQQGSFTLHGSRRFDLDSDQASSLLCVPVLKEHKLSLLNELGRVGMGEMFIFPEPEHVCAHLKRAARL